MSPLLPLPVLGVMLRRGSLLSETCCFRNCFSSDLLSAASLPFLLSRDVVLAGFLSAGPVLGRAAKARVWSLRAQTPAAPPALTWAPVPHPLLSPSWKKSLRLQFLGHSSHVSLPGLQGAPRGSSGQPPLRFSPFAPLRRELLLGLRGSGGWC